MIETIIVITCVVVAIFIFIRSEQEIESSFSSRKTPRPKKETEPVKKPFVQKKSDEYYEAIIKNNNRDRFHAIQANFDEVMKKKNMQTTLDQVSQLGRLTLDELEASWEYSVVNKIPESHVEEYTTYWKNFHSEVTNYYNEITRLELDNQPGPNLTKIYKMVKAINKGIVSGYAIVISKQREKIQEGIQDDVYTIVTSFRQTDHFDKQREKRVPDVSTEEFIEATRVAFNEQKLIFKGVKRNAGVDYYFSYLGHRVICNWFKNEENNKHILFLTSVVHKDKVNNT